MTILMLLMLGAACSRSGSSDSASSTTSPAQDGGASTGGRSGDPASNPGPDSELDLRGTVTAVDTSAGTIRIDGSGSPYSVLVVRGTTEFRGGEGEPAALTEVRPGTLVAVLGRPEGGNRLAARLITILS